jgi:tol-pal system protein YbgF
MNASRLLVIGLAFSPTLLLAQKREDILSIQRDIAALTEQVRQIQRTQDERMAALTALVQQAMDVSNKANASLSALQHSVTTQLADQQSKVVMPTTVLGSKVDQMADDFRSMQTNMADLTRRVGQLDQKLTDISSAVRTLSAPLQAPTRTIPQANTPQGPPAGTSAETLYTNAFRDYTTGKYDLAMQEFSDYLKYFPQTENAPAAQYYIGYTYFNANQYEDAVKAFDAVRERFPENPKTPDALYMKGVSLMKAGRRTDAGTEFKSFVKRYPNHELASKAHAHLKDLGLESSRSGGLLLKYVLARREADLIDERAVAGRGQRSPLAERWPATLLVQAVQPCQISPSNIG